MRPGTSDGSPGAVLGGGVGDPAGVGDGPGEPPGEGAGVGVGDGLGPGAPCAWSSSRSESPSAGAQTTFVADATMIRWNSGKLLAVDCRYTGWRYSSESPTGTTIRLPRTTWLPDWLHNVNCALICGSWSMRASIWAGPNTVVSVGNL